jgi:hypothetical protein
LGRQRHLNLSQIDGLNGCAMRARFRTLIWGANGDESSLIPGYALDMVADDPLTRDALQAVAFGRVVTPEDRDAAARALQALRELDERAGRTRVADIPAVAMPAPGAARRAGADVASGLVVVEVVDDSQALSYDAWRGGPRRVTESLRRFWVVPVVVASLAVGAVGGVVATHAAEKSSASLAPAAQTTAPADSGPSDSAEQREAAAAAESEVTALSTAAVLANVEAWLGPPRLPSDNFPDEATLTASGIDPSSTHFVMTGGTMRLWAARGFDGSLCLVMMATVDGGSQSGCVPENQFLIDGVSIAGDSASAHWRTDGTIESKG